MEHFFDMAQTSETTFVGYVNVKGYTIYLFIQFPLDWKPGNSLRETQIFMDSESVQLFGNLKTIFTQKMSVLRNTLDFFEELYAFLERSLPIRSMPVLPISLLTDLYKDLKPVESMILSVDPSFSIIQFHSLITLPNQVEIRVDCHITEEYPNCPPVFKCEMIPDENKTLSVCWSPSGKFSVAINDISKSLLSYLPFWKELLHIDSTVITKEDTCLSEPQRTIDLGNFCSLRIYLLPLHPRSGKFASSWAFLGPPTKVHPYQLKFHQQLNKWNPELSVIENIETILEIKLPKKKTSNVTVSTESTFHCEICYDAFETNLQEVSCGCGRFYHRECLLT
ncbi:hypothetical protein HMI56_003686, partial [Coelomomyces lativittatus]